jgi:hypothetical protein
MNTKRLWEDHPGEIVAAVTVIVVLVVGLVWSVARDTSDTLDPALARVTLESCSGDGATGTVENLADRSVTPVVEVRFLGADGEVIQKGSVTRPGMTAGEVVPWVIPFRADLVQGEATVVSCGVGVPTLFKFNS